MAINVHTPGRYVRRAQVRSDAPRQLAAAVRWLRAEEPAVISIRPLAGRGADAALSSEQAGDGAQLLEGLEQWRSRVRRKRAIVALRRYLLLGVGLSLVLEGLALAGAVAELVPAVPVVLALAAAMLEATRRPSLEAGRPPARRSARPVRSHRHRTRAAESSRDRGKPVGSPSGIGRCRAHRADTPAVARFERWRQARVAVPGGGPRSACSPRSPRAVAQERAGRFRARCIDRLGQRRARPRSRIGRGPRCEPTEDRRRGRADAASPALGSQPHSSRHAAAARLHRSQPRQRSLARQSRGRSRPRGSPVLQPRLRVHGRSVEVRREHQDRSRSGLHARRQGIGRRLDSERGRDLAGGDTSPVGEHTDVQRHEGTVQLAVEPNQGIGGSGLPGHEAGQRRRACRHAERRPCSRIDHPRQPQDAVRSGHPRPAVAVRIRAEQLHRVHRGAGVLQLWRRGWGRALDVEQHLRTLGVGDVRLRPLRRRRGRRRRRGSIDQLHLLAGVRGGTAVVVAAAP